MPSFSMTCVFAMLALWRALCASVLLLASDPSRDKPSIGYEPRNDPFCVRVMRFAGSCFEDGSVTAIHKRLANIFVLRCMDARFTSRWRVLSSPMGVSSFVRG